MARTGFIQMHRWSSTAKPPLGRLQHSLPLAGIAHRSYRRLWADKSSPIIPTGLPLARSETTLQQDRSRGIRSKVHWMNCPQFFSLPKVKSIANGLGVVVVLHPPASICVYRVAEDQTLGCEAREGGETEQRHSAKVEYHLEIEKRPEMRCFCRGPSAIHRLTQRLEDEDLAKV